MKIFGIKIKLRDVVTVAALILPLPVGMVVNAIRADKADKRY